MPDRVLPSQESTSVERERIISTQQHSGEMTCWQCGSTYDAGTRLCPDDGTRLVALSLSDNHDPLLGQTLDDRYRIDGVIGEGGMGTVYRARDLEQERDIAMKVLKADYLRDKNIRRRFMDEARIISNLEHPNAVKLYNFGQMPDGNFYMVMELLHGESLAERLAYKFLSYREIFEIIPPVCEVLDEAHRMGIVHRDIKPENIYIQISPKGKETARLLDFGVAKQLESENITRTGTLWGTPAYMSPEQSRGDDVGAGADIYGIGTIMYELIGGTLPFFASTQMGYAIKHMNESPRRISTLPGLDSIPDELDALILSALQKQPDARPLSMADFAESLREIIERYKDESWWQSVPAQEVDPIALQTWVRAPDLIETASISGDLFPEAPQTRERLRESTYPDSPSVVLSSDSILIEPSNDASERRGWLNFAALGFVIFIGMLALGVLIRKIQGQAKTVEPSQATQVERSPAQDVVSSAPTPLPKPAPLNPERPMQLGALTAADITMSTMVFASTLNASAASVLQKAIKRRSKASPKVAPRRPPSESSDTKTKKALRRTF